MSVGVIYCYFVNKEVIIEVIVVNDLVEMWVKFVEWEILFDNVLFDSLLDMFEMVVEYKYIGDNVVLVLEVLVEVVCNFCVVVIVENVDV